MRYLKLLLLAPLTFAAIAQQTVDERIPPKIKRVLEQSEKLRAEKIEFLREDIKRQKAHLGRLQKGVVRPKEKGVIIPATARDPIVFPSAESKRQSVEDARARLRESEERLQALRKRDTLCFPTLSFPPKVGDIGYLEREAANVKQVIDDENMLINAYFTVEIRTARNNRPVTMHETRHLVFLVRGVSTQGAADGLGFSLPQVFEVTGTEQYKTVNGGTNTVLVIEPFDVKGAEAIWKKHKDRP
jgi:hypothetical protein